MIDTTLKNQLLQAYHDKTIYANHTVYLNFRGLLYVELGRVDAECDKDTINRLGQCTTSTMLVYIDTVPGYGDIKYSKQNAPEFGEIIAVNTYDLENDELAAKKKGNKVRNMCECGCCGDVESNEVYLHTWYEIKSDDELVERSIWLSEI